MKIGDAFPSNYIRSADLKGLEVPVTISHFQLEELGDGGEEKPVLYFRGGKKGLILNRTNADVLDHNLGEETDNWTDCKVILHVTKVRYKGSWVEGLRIKFPANPDKVSRLVKNPSDKLIIEQLERTAPTEEPRSEIPTEAPSANEASTLDGVNIPF